MIRRFSLCLLVFALSGLPARAQVPGEAPTAATAPAQPGTQAQAPTGTGAGTGQDPAAMGEAVRKVPMLTLPKETITIPENEPIPLDMVLRDVPGATPDLLDGVTAKAFTRYVTVDGQRIGQLVLTAVTKEDRIEELPHELFVSQFEIKTAPVLPTAEEVTIEGDQDTMIAALMRLQEKEETDQAEKKEKEKESRDSRSGQDGAAGSSGRSSNSDAANYQTPDKLKVSKTDANTDEVLTDDTEEEVVIPEVVLTTDGCSIRVDLAQGVAIQQNRVEITTGSTTETEACADGPDRFPILSTSAGCPDRVDLAAGAATPAFRLYYTGPDGSETRVTACQPDPQRSFPIEEDEAGCALQEDDYTQTSVRLQRLIYHDANNTTVVVQDCQPIETRRVLTRGCDIRVDLDQGMAIQQVRTETFGEDGTSSEQCRDGTTRYPILFTSAGCPDRVDFAARTATAQRRLIYIDPTGQEVEVTRCANNAEQVFPITEDRTVCSHSVDYEKMTVVPQAQWVYVDANNATVVVQDCEPAEGAAPVPLVETEEGCTLRHDFASNRSNRQTKLIYHMGDLTYQASDCVDSDTWHPHLRLHETADGQQVCPPVIDTNGKVITRASRVQITVDGVPEYITECQPDTVGSALLATTDGCDNPGTWPHNLSAGQSVGQERYYYTRQNGQREYVTGCQPSTVTYPHQIQVVGWQPHDEQRFAYLLSTVYIMTPKGRFDLVLAEVLPGTAQYPYVKQRDLLTQTEQIFYSGCTRFARTEKTEVWLRPDGSEYIRPMGAGASANLGSACQTQKPGTPSQWTLVSTQGWRRECRSQAMWRDGDNSEHKACTAVYVFQGAQYQSSLTTVREDGTTMSATPATKWETAIGQTSCQQSGEKDLSCAALSLSWSAAPPPAPQGLDSFSDPVTYPGLNRSQPQSSSVAAWLAELGW
ncbi:hypothetical protein [Rhodospirillum sp. A1_3_36]|uniref:hypothetical protein n=1 Tax=Rhodospirillum sp. A1_3_36 TaxID=3391666 RepID=UPI0039A4AF01